LVSLKVLGKLATLNPTFVQATSSKELSATQTFVIVKIDLLCLLKFIHQEIIRSKEKNRPEFLYCNLHPKIIKRLNYQSILPKILNMRLETTKIGGLP